jgi:hypothetical protein
MSNSNKRVVWNVWSYELRRSVVFQAVSRVPEKSPVFPLVDKNKCRKFLSFFSRTVRRNPNFQKKITTCESLGNELDAVVVNLLGENINIKKIIANYIRCE